jgi:AraC-like DNA-binding protein
MNRGLIIRAVDRIQRYSTTSAGSRANIAYWNGVLRELLVPLKVTANDPGNFEAELMIGHFGKAIMSDVRSSPANVDYDINHVGQIDAHFYTLMMTVDCRCRFRAFGHESILEAGDLVLNDSHVPSQLQFSRPARILSIRIEPKALSTFMPATEQYLGTPIRQAHVMGKVLGRMLLGFWEQIAEGLPNEYAGTLEQSLLQVLASYFALEHASQILDSSSKDLRRTTIKRYVEANLTDSVLSAQSIANAMSVSTRYVFRAFSGESESLAAYIQRRRLEQVSIYLRSPLWSHWTVTRIAMHWGFASAPHFSRLFRQHFRMTPGEYRRQAA